MPCAVARSTCHCDRIHFASATCPTFVEQSRSAARPLLSPALPRRVTAPDIQRHLPCDFSRHYDGPCRPGARRGGVPSLARAGVDAIAAGAACHGSGAAGRVGVGGDSGGSVAGAGRVDHHVPGGTQLGY